MTKSCSQCGTCCKLFFINLTQEEYKSGEYNTELKEFVLDDNFKTVQDYGGNILGKKADGNCIYLENNLCSIHERRPKSCRSFFCESKSKKFKSMVNEIKKEKLRSNILD